MDELDNSLTPIAIPTIISRDAGGSTASVSGLSDLSIWDMISRDSSGMNNILVPPASPSENLVADGFVFQQPDRNYSIPRLYEKVGELRSTSELNFNSTVMTFNNGYIYVGSTEGIVRRFSPSKLTMFGKDMLLDEESDEYAGRVIDINTTISEYGVLIVGENRLSFYSHALKKSKLIKGEGKFLRLFQTYVGNFIVGTDGYLYELIKLALPEEFKLARVERLTELIRAADFVCNNRSNVGMGIIMAIDCSDSIALIKVCREQGILILTKVYEFQTDMRSPLMLSVSSKYLFVTSGSNQFVQSQGMAFVSAMDWVDLVQNFYCPNYYLIPGQEINAMTCFEEKLLITTGDRKVVLLNAINMKKIRVIELNVQPDIVFYHDNHLLFTTKFNAITCVRFPKNSFVCPRCLPKFDEYPLNYDCSVFTTRYCNHFFP